MWFKYLMHRVFGWEYYTIHWGFGDTAAVRAYTAPNGRKFTVYCSTVIFLDDPHRRAQRII